MSETVYRTSIPCMRCSESFTITVGETAPCPHCGRRWRSSLDSEDVISVSPAAPEQPPQRSTP